MTVLDQTRKCFLEVKYNMPHRPYFLINPYYYMLTHYHHDYTSPFLYDNTGHAFLTCASRIHAEWNVCVCMCHYMLQWNIKYLQTSDIRRTLVCNKLVDHSDVVVASPVGAAPTTSSFSIKRLASMDSAKTNAGRDKESFKLWDLVPLILELLLQFSFLWGWNGKVAKSTALTPHEA